MTYQSGIRDSPDDNIGFVTVLFFVGVALIHTAALVACTHLASVMIL